MHTNVLTNCNINQLLTITVLFGGAAVMHFIRSAKLL